MTKLIYKFTDLLLVQSSEFKNYILNQGVAESKIIYYPYYAEDFYKVVEKDKSYLSQFPKGFNLLFAGNIGVAQSFNTIVNAFEKLKEYDINLVILGDGRDKSRIQEQINEKGLKEKFHFLGSFPPEQMPYYFTCADGLLITLKKADIFSYTIPGKLQSYLACGKPIIGALDGIGNKIISESNSGFASEAENHELLANNILTLYKLSKMEKEKLSNNALDYFDKNFNKQHLLEILEEILN
jgi:glycosyltransferase involved in cell wall biosynthesis